MNCRFRKEMSSIGFTFSCDQACDPATDPKRCKCRAAVLNAYKELRDDGPEKIAREAAEMIYGYHNPMDSLDDCALIVDRWINAENLH